MSSERRAVGEVRARYESDLAFRVSGKMVARLVDVGVSVRKGDLVARLDDQDYRNRLKSAESDIVAADAVLEESRNAEVGSASSWSGASRHAATTTQRSGQPISK